MSKDFFVLRAGRVVYTPGHYDQDGAESTARRVLEAHPKATVTIVKVVDRYQGPAKGPIDGGG